MRHFVPYQWDSSGAFEIDESIINWGIALRSCGANHLAFATLSKNHSFFNLLHKHAVIIIKSSCKIFIVQLIAYTCDHNYKLLIKLFDRNHSCLLVNLVIIVQRNCSLILFVENNIFIYIYILKNF